MMRQAYDKAGKVLAAQTTLTAERARQVAPAVVDAATDAIRADYAAQLGTITGRQAAVRGVGMLALGALEVAFVATVAARGRRWARAVAAVAVAAQVGLYVDARRHTAKLRRSARAAARSAEFCGTTRKAGA